MKNNNQNWFCQCCTKVFKRDNPTLLQKGSLNEICYQICNMCTVCFKECNDVHNFEELINDLEVKKKENGN